MFLNFLFLPSAFAGGPILGARSTGMGTAFTAVADDPSTIAVNPAGLTQLKGTELYGGTTFIIPSTEYTSLNGHTEETEFQIFFPPHLYVVSDLKKENLRFGLGIFSLYGIGAGNGTRMVSPDIHQLRALSQPFLSILSSHGRYPQFSQ
jgi:long-subunit fatty acid transport protein